MKKCIFFLLIFIFAVPAFAGERVRGHWRDSNSDGVKNTYVQPYYRSKRNNTTLDNYSTKGNVNPYTRKKGYIDPYKKQEKKSVYQPSYNPYKIK